MASDSVTSKPVELGRNGTITEGVGEGQVLMQESVTGNITSAPGVQPTETEIEYATEWEKIEKLGHDIDKLRKEHREAAEAMTEQDANLAAVLKIANKHLKALQSSINSNADLAHSQQKAYYNKLIDSKRRDFAKASKVLPQANSMVLSWAVGDINVTLPRLADRMRYKQNYELFKLKMAFAALCFTLSRFFLQYMVNHVPRALDTLFLLFMSWYYTTIVLREHVLLANGSMIRPWWMWHHYLSLCMVAILQVWPDSESYRNFYPRFNFFACFIDFIQLLEFNYQRRRMYKLRALGKTDAMALPSEGVQEVQWDQGLSILVPFLVVCQGLIFYMTYYLVNIARSPDCTEWQPAALAGVFAVLAAGNMYTNTTSLMKKIQPRQRLSKHDKKEK